MKASARERHQALVEKARKAINVVYGDTTVSPMQTAESLRLLRDEIQEKLEALREDKA